MKSFFTKYLLSAFASAALIFMVIGLISAIKCKGLGSSDAAGWMQAIGAVVSIWAVIWIARKSERSQERKDRTVAVLAAAESWTRLQLLASDIHRYSTHFVISAGGAKTTNADLGEYIAWSKNGSKLSSDEILKFTGLGNDCAENLARVNADIFAVGVVARDILGYIGPAQEEIDKELKLIRLGAIFVRADGHMRAAMNEIRKVVNPNLSVESE